MRTWGPLYAGQIAYREFDPASAGRMFHHRSWGWAVLTPEGEIWSVWTGETLCRRRDLADERCIPWHEQTMGVGVIRCPETEGVSEQPERVFLARRGPRNNRDRYIRKRRADGVSLAQIAREVGVSRERIKQLLEPMRPRWVPV